VSTVNQIPFHTLDTYLDILRNCNVEQIVDFPTRGNKTLDIFLTSNPGLIDRCKPIPGVGDHDAVLIDTLTIHLWDKANITEAANPEIRFLVIMLQLDKFFQGST
jgi:predicted nucleic acid binding AN1-type Zn finger protein